MNPWKKLRLPVLIVTFTSALFVFGRTITDSSIGKRTATPFVFPSAVPLPPWQFMSSKPLPNQIVEQLPYGKLILPGMHYRYQQNGIPLKIDMRYEVNTAGDVKQLIEMHTDVKFLPNQPMPIIREHKLGFYGVYVYQQQAYLDACINPSGGSTFTSAQFDYNRIHYDLQFQRLLLWLLGRQELRDNRCLWTHLSIPLNQSDPDAYSTLEQAWFSWYKWWQTRFPKL